MSQATLQKHDCDRCGNSYKKSALRRQRGMLLCSSCYDNLKRIERPNPRWQSPRDNSSTTTAVNTPNIFYIGVSGFTSLGWSRDYTYDGTHLHYYMQVEGSGGAVDITANPQILAGQYGDLLTIRGNSDTNTILLEDGDGVRLIHGHSMLFKEGDSMTLVYIKDSVTVSTSGFGTGAFGTMPFGSGTTVLQDGWVEVSRNKGGI